MTEPPRKHWQTVAVALAGLALAAAGLWLALLSNPRRFPLDVAADATIGMLALSGFVCTLAGVALFVAALRHTTTSMPARFRTNANLGIGFGFVLHLLGVFLPATTPLAESAGCALILSGLVAFVWGATNYAQGKGQSPSLGLLGLLGVFGLIVLILLPYRNEAVPTADK